MENWYSDFLVARDVFLDKVTFQQRLEDIEGAWGNFQRKICGRYLAFVFYMEGWRHLVARSRKVTKSEIELYLVAWGIAKVADVLQLGRWMERQRWFQEGCRGPDHRDFYRKVCKTLHKDFYGPSYAVWLSFWMTQEATWRVLSGIDHIVTKHPLNIPSYKYMLNEYMKYLLEDWKNKYHRITQVTTQSVPRITYCVHNCWEETDVFPLKK